MSRGLVVISVLAGLVIPLAKGDDMSAGQSARPAANPAPLQDGLEYSTLVTAANVTRHLSAEAGCRHAARQFLAAGFRRIWLEIYRGGHRVQLDIARRARDIFREEGLIVSGVVTTTWGEGFGKRSSSKRGFFCYSAPESQQFLSEIATDACRLFDEVMYDDFMFTDCRCQRCRREKGDRSWAQYRCDVKSRVARDFIVRPGHAVNPNVVIIVKYPQWYDKLHQYGYDVIRDTANFDAIWIGTETRGPDTPRYGFVPLYQSSVTFPWLRGIGGRKTRGGWFDYYDCTTDEYVDQAYCTVLNGATELMRFHGFASLPGSRHDPLLSAFAEHRPHLEKLARIVRGRQPIGLWAYKPPYSSSGDEDFWLDYFGNMGVPLLATAKFPPPGEGATLVLTRAARHDPEIDRRVADWAARAGSLIVTTGFLADASREVRELFGIRRVESKPIDADSLRVGAKLVECPQPMPLGGLLEPAAAVVRVTGQVGQDLVPVLTIARTPAGGLAAVLNLRTHDIGEVMLMDKVVPWIDLPAPAANEVREVALTGTGLHLEAPTRVIVHPFAGNLVSLINARNTATRIRLKLCAPWFPLAPDHVTVHPGGQQLTASPDATFELTMPARARWMLLGQDRPGGTG